MAKNRNQPNNQNEERNAPHRESAEDVDSTRKASGRTEQGRTSRSETTEEGGRSRTERSESGERSSGSSRNAGSDRSMSASPSELQEGSERIGKGRQARETEGLDVEQADDSRQDV